MIKQDYVIKSNFQISDEDGKAIMIVKEGSIEFPEAKNVEISKSDLRTINSKNQFEKIGNVVTFVIRSGEVK